MNEAWLSTNCMFMIALCNFYILKYSIFEVGSFESLLFVSSHELYGQVVHLKASSKQECTPCFTCWMALCTQPYRADLGWISARLAALLVEVRTLLTFFCVFFMLLTRTVRYKVTRYQPAFIQSSSKLLCVQAKPFQHVIVKQLQFG